MTNCQSITLVLGMFLLAGCAAPPPPPPEVKLPSKLLGVWRSNVQFKDGPFASMKDLNLMYSFNEGGTMTESSNYDESQPVPPAYGIWRDSGSNKFEAKYVYYNTKPPATFPEIAKGGGWHPSGWGELKETITASPDGQSYESTLTLQMFDEKGKAIPGGGSATGHGMKIRF